MCLIFLFTYTDQKGKNKVEIIEVKPDNQACTRESLGRSRA